MAIVDEPNSILPRLGSEVDVQYPPELVSRRQWVCWRTEIRKDKPTKVPINPSNGCNAKPDNLLTCADFEHALAAVAQHSADGVGFVFSDDDLMCVDLDGCRNPDTGEIAQGAWSLLQRLGSFTEVSPSGTGLHVFIRAERKQWGGHRNKLKIPTDWRFADGSRIEGKASAVEFLFRNCYSTVTGRRVEGTRETVELRQAEVDALYAELASTKEQRRPEPEASPPPDQAEIPDDELLAKMRASRQVEKFERLWAGDCSEQNNDRSAADMALCMMLAFWTRKNAGQTDRLFRRSGLMREKWDEVHYASGDTYGQGTIRQAFDKTGEIYSLAPEIPHGFEVTETGVYFRKAHPQRQGETVRARVSSPLRVTALGRDSDQSDWQIVVEFEDPDRETHVQLIPKEWLGGDGSEYRKALYSWGVDIDDKALLGEYLKRCRPQGRVRTVQKVGWFGSVFVLPDDVIGDAGGESILFQGPERHRHPFRSSGTAEGWREQIGRFCSGNSRLLFAASCAFAGPLIPLLHTMSPGFHLVGGSSVGKTTALEVAGSVCGGGRKSGYLKTWRATTNGAEIQAEMHNHTLLCMDEMGQVDPREVGAMAYMLCNGQGKSRMRRNTAAARSYEWQLVLLSSGEVSLEEHAAEGKQKVKAGQRVRIADVPAEASAGHGLFERIHGFESPASFANHLKRACQNFYGAPLREFLKLLVADREEVERRYRARVKSLESRFAKEGSGGEVSRAALNFALVGAAGEAATGMGLTGFTEGECEQAALTCFQAWLHRRGTKGDSDEEAMVRQVKLFIEQHGSSRFEDLDASYQDDSKRPRVHDRAGFRRRSGDDVEFIFFPETFRAEVCRGFDHRRVVRTLTDRGLLVAEAGRSQVRRQVPGHEDGQTRFYVVRQNTMIGGVEQPY